jgi:hypothetical protein
MGFRYYRCPSCNLTFKTLASAIDHKTTTMHGDIQEEHIASRYQPFPPIDLSKVLDSIPEVLPFEEISIGESTEPEKRKEFYVCLSCRLTFKDRASAVEHRFNSRHKVVKENYPIEPSYPTSFEKITEIVGSNTDYEAFYQRTIDDVPNEN